MTDTDGRPPAGSRSGAPGRPRTEPCGTPAGHARHVRAGETPVRAHCEPCADAERARQAEAYRRRKAHPTHREQP